MDNSGEVNSLARFHQHSRLHFIGQWKTKAADVLKAYYTEHPERDHGVIAKQRAFMHVDMDAYFCSIALSREENAKYRDCPVAIAAGSKNSEIASCNYVARSFGVHASMYVVSARKLCPQLVVLQYDFPRCEEVNCAVYAVLLEACPACVLMCMEVLSVDEVLIAFDTDNYDVLEEYAKRIRAEIERVSSGCTASCGISNTILCARLATSFAKPNGIRVVRPNQVGEFIANVKVKDLHGVGSRTLAKLINAFRATFPNELQPCEGSPVPPPAGLIRENSGNVNDTAEPDMKASGSEDDEKADDAEAVLFTCSMLERLPLSVLCSAVGQNNGAMLHSFCRGIDRRRCKRTGTETTRQNKLPTAVGCTMNYAVRPHSATDVLRLFSQLIVDTCAKLRHNNAAASTFRVQLLERHPDAPFNPPKYLGCGRCIERRYLLKSPAPLSGDDAPAIERLCFDTVTKHVNEKRSDDGAVANASSDELHVVYVEDIRGVGFSASAMSECHGADNESNECRQVSLTAAFQKQLERRETSATANTSPQAPPPLLSVPESSEACSPRDVSCSVEISSQPLVNKARKRARNSDSDGVLQREEGAEDATLQLVVQQLSGLQYSHSAAVCAALKATSADHAAEVAELVLGPHAPGACNVVADALSCGRSVMDIVDGLCEWAIAHRDLHAVRTMCRIAVRYAAAAPRGRLVAPQRVESLISHVNALVSSHFPLDPKVGPWKMQIF